MSGATSYYAKRVDRAGACARLLAASLANVARLEAALAANWDVASELELERARVAAYSAA